MATVKKGVRKIGAIGEVSESAWIVPDPHSGANAGDHAYVMFERADDNSAPRRRFFLRLITDDDDRVLRAGTRLLWSF